MVRDSALPPESFEEILAWLNPDREVAGAMYVQLRHDLAKIFMWARCLDPEGLTDEVFDRVAKKVRDVRPAYVGDPRNYFHGVANNLIKEELKKIKTRVSLEEVDFLHHPTVESKAEAEEIDECLQACLQELTNEKRKLIFAYYAKEKQAKIHYRNQLAQEFGISVENLRVKVFRIRASLEQCIQRCLKRKRQQV